MLAAIRAIHFGAVLLLFGGFAFLVCVARPTFREAAIAAKEEAGFHRWLLNVAGITVVVALISGAWWLGLEAAQLSGVPWQEGWRPNALGAVLNETRFGQLWKVRFGIAVLLGVLIVWARRYPNSQTGPTASALGVLLAALLLATLALAGHAAAWAGTTTDLRMIADALRRLAAFAWIRYAAAVPVANTDIAVAADAVHLLAAGAWIGALPPLVFLLTRSERATARLSIAGAASRHSSTLGMVSVSSLVVSGLVNSWYLVGGVPGLLGTSYGRLLMLKLGLFALMLALAAANRLRWTPALSATRATGNASDAEVALRRLKRNASWETVLAFAIVVIVGRLGTTVPGAHEQPLWPFSFTLNWSELGELSGLHVALAVAGVFAAGLLILVLKRRGVRKVFASAIGIGVALAVPVWFSTVPAYPTTYFHAPVRYTATSIARGDILYRRYCASCHGAYGYGDGPATAALPVKPIDLTSHLFRHREGDLFWWLSNGVAGTSMPGFSVTIGDAERWDIVNFLYAQSEAERAKYMNGDVEPWLGIVAPDFTFESERGAQEALIQQRARRNVLLVLFTYPESVPRLCLLAKAKDKLNRGGVGLLAIPINRAAMNPLRTERAHELCLQPLIAAAPDSDVVTAYTLFRRVPPRNVPPVALHSEFLIDRQGYLRARWTAPLGYVWDGQDELLRQVSRMDRLEKHPPAPEGRSH